jgi:ribose transport system ATP-binding protein
MSRDTDMLAIEGLTKTFGATHALSDVSLRIERGEVHALVGQNGSGKSTLIKILSGYHAPDAGSIRARGEEVKLPIAPGESRKLGIGFMHQDLGLVESMSVLENLRVGRFRTGVGWHVRWRSEQARAREVLARFGLGLDPRKPVQELSQTERAIVGVIRALEEVGEADGPGLLVLDEPTASLPRGEVDLLFEAVRRVTEAGSSVLFVSHSLEEVLTLSDRVTVLRDGRVAASEATKDVNERSLIELILGRPLGDMYPTIEESTPDRLLEVRGLSGAIVSDVSFTLNKGEVLGLTGLIGAGHDEIPYLLFGASRMSEGVVELDGEVLAELSPEACKRAGMALLPADRQRQAGIMGATVKENVTMAALPSFRRHGRIDHARERSTVQQVLTDFDVRPPVPGRPLSTLSGGNQQKALLARWLHVSPRVMILHEPTQGIDVGARKGIFEILRKAVEEGMSIVYSSAEYEELANLCDRVLVFRGGRLVTELAGANLTQDRIVANCYQSDPRGNGNHTA